MINHPTVENVADFDSRFGNFLSLFCRLNWCPRNWVGLPFVSFEYHLRNSFMSACNKFFWCFVYIFSLTMHRVSVVN